MLLKTREQFRGTLSTRQCVVPQHNDAGDRLPNRGSMNSLQPYLNPAAGPLPL